MAVSNVSSTASVAVSSRIKAAAAALFLGFFFIYGAGLANSQTLHDAAHDSRHSFGFPCH